MQQTTYYKLSQQEYGEAPDVALINGNMDVIDTALHRARTRETDVYSEQASYKTGDFVIYQDALYRCTADTSGVWDVSKWQATTIVQAFEPKRTWSLFETITADGTAFQYIRDLPETTSGIMVICYFKATTQAATHFREELSFDGTNYIVYGYIGNAITNADRYGRIDTSKDGDLWTGLSTDASTTDAGIAQTRTVNNACVISSTAPKKIKLRSTSGQTNIESGSTFEIYIRR